MSLKPAVKSDPFHVNLHVCAFVQFFFRVVIDNESCKNATVIRVYLSICFSLFFLSKQFVSLCCTLLAFHFFIFRIFWYLFHFMMQVDSANKQGILLEVVQVLTDLNLIITKAYISSDGGWFMDGKIFLFRIFKIASMTRNTCPLSFSLSFFAFYVPGNQN